MDRAGKQASVDNLSQSISAVRAVFAIDYRGLKVEQATEFRRKIRESGASYKVIKNTLAKRAIAGTGFEALEPHLEGMTGLAFTESDPVALAKVINDYAKDVPAIVYKAGLLMDQTLTVEQFKELADLPSREELLSKLLSVLQAPVQNLLGVLQAPARDLLLVLQAKADKEKGEAA